VSSVLVVEDGASPYVLAAVRSLGRAGWRVGVASPVPNPRVTPSRFADRWHACRLPEDDLAGFVDDVAAIVAAGRYDVVFGADDIELLALSWGRDRLGAVFPHAPHEAVLAAVDKLSLTRAAERAGLGVPRTVEPGPGPLRLDLPVVVKARLHWTPASAAADRHLLVRVCDSPAQVEEQVRRIEAGGGRALVQEVLSGEQVALSAVVSRAGELLAVSQQRTVLSSLARTSSRAETVPVDEALADAAVRLLRDLSWQGLANLQFLRSDDGGLRLIDLNGRFYGSLALAVAAGADLPAVWAADAVGRPAGPVQQARAGVRFAALHADLLRARRERRDGLLRDLGSSVAWARGAAHSTWSPDDVRPALATARRLVVDGIRRRVRRSRG
jgi:predicted ATP-grasp superfamily ATP-dependent carboligase